MELNEIVALVGKTIYVVEKDVISREVSPNRYIVTGEIVYNYTKYIVEEVRFTNEYYYGTESNVVFVYNIEYDDCYDYFVPNFIGKTVFFTEEEAKQTIEKLNEQKGSEINV